MTLSGNNIDVYEGLDVADARVRERFRFEARSLRNAYAGVLWAMEKRFKETNESVSQQIRTLRQDVEREFGSMSKAFSRLLGPVLLWTSRREEKRLAAGKTYEPPTIIERTHWVEA